MTDTVTKTRAKGDSRVTRSRAAVLAATLELLIEAGFSGVSVDEVARRSGVAKTTIYRHWPSREALLKAACAAKESHGGVPNTGNWRDDVRVIVRGIAKTLRTDPWASVVPSIVDAAERDREVEALETSLHAMAMSGLTSIIARAQHEGHLDRRSDAATIVAALIGPLFYRRWFSREPLDAKFVDRIVDSVIATEIQGARVKASRSRTRR